MILMMKGLFSDSDNPEAMTQLTPLAPPTPEEIAAVLKALSEPNRLRIFAELMAGDTCNCELVERLALPANLLSHHLKVLSEAGLVNSRRDRLDGRWVYYSVDRATAARWQAWFAAFFDPAQIRTRPVCGPEGQPAATTPASAGCRSTGRGSTTATPATGWRPTAPPSTPDATTR